MVYATPVVVTLLTVWFFRELTQPVSRGDRRPMPVAALQGVILLAGAMGCLGIGMTLVSLSVTQLVALGFGIILLALLVAAYGVKLIRTHP